MNKAHRSLRRGPDILMRHVADVLMAGTWYEFKSLFDVVFDNLRALNAANGGEEMLRLRAYEKLQSLVQQGAVEKSGKMYRGIAPALQAMLETMTAQERARAAHRAGGGVPSNSVAA